MNERKLINTIGALSFIVLTSIVVGCQASVAEGSGELAEATLNPTAPPTQEKSPDPTRPVILVPTLQRVDVNGHPVKARPGLSMASVQNTRAAIENPYATPLPRLDAEATARTRATMEAAEVSRFGPTSTGSTPTPVTGPNR